MGRNDFEGYDSERVYALLAKSPVFGELAAHPLVLDVCEQVLGANFMLSACLAINTHPGENAQPLHFDDSFYRVPRPRPAYGVSAFWAIDDFTQDNGPTEIIPGSHKWGGDAPVGVSFHDAFVNGKHVPVEDHPDLEQVIMPAGSLMLTPGTLWHRGGANNSNGSRLAITPQYCVAWGRQMESDAALRAARNRCPVPRAHPAAARLQHPPAVHGPRERHAPARILKELQQ